MIPVPLFSASFFIVLGVSALAVLALSLWVIVLCLSRAARRWSSRHRAKSRGLLFALLILSFPLAYVTYAWVKVSGEIAREWDARHPTLSETTRIHGLDLPAGTRLSLPSTLDLKATEEAEFSSPVPVHGIPALSVRFTSIWDDQASQDSQAELPIHELRIVEQATVDGWRCNAEKPLRLAVRAEMGISLMDCLLAAGNRVAGLDIPAGSELMRYTTTYGDGQRDPDVWRIDVHAPLQLAQLPLSGVTLLFDRERKLFGFESANLARDFTFGEMSYPAGTQVQSANRSLRDRYPGTWLFSPVNGKAARREGGETIAEGMTVIQQPDGRIDGQVSNADAGVFIFEDFGAASGS